ncbi:MAG: hypothetical protein LBC74_04760 [Planctomycetaceae bacterium]|nr:hypothetical protein [Planctomycetaceae bacterium]
MVLKMTAFFVTIMLTEKLLNSPQKTVSAAITLTHWQSINLGVCGLVI